MSTTNLIPLQQMLGIPVIRITNGETIAKVADIQLDPANLIAILVITYKVGLFKGDLEAIRVD
jgi:sporulation protein YlmC with PRC-barrel domain